MNQPRPMREAMVAAALSPWFAKTAVSSLQLRDIATFACTANDALAQIRKASERAIELGAALDPKSLLAFLADNNLILQETNDANADAN